MGARLTRRRALAAAASCLASPAWAGPREPGLNTLAARGGRFYGAAIADPVLANDPAAMAHAATECGMLTGETAFKWGELRPTPDAWNWAPADALMRFAASHRIATRGHTLLWHEHNPAWLLDQLSPSTAEPLLAAHIQAAATHCRHRVTQWDVVNEVLSPADGLPGGFRNTPWFQALGPRLLEVAFGACAAADPAPLRCINEYGFEYDWDDTRRKRDAMLELLTAARSTDIPIQALGMQAHLEAGQPLDQPGLAQFCTDVAKLGCQIVITELDVRDNRLPADPALRDAAVAAAARDYLSVVLPCPAVLGVLTWGLSDRRTWLNDFAPRPDALPQRPLPLDADLQRTPMWTALAQAFQSAPPLPAKKPPSPAGGRRPE